MDETLLAELRRVLGDRILAHEADDVPTIVVAPSDLYGVVEDLYRDESLAFTFLTTLFGMHYPAEGRDLGADAKGAEAKGDELGLQVLLYNMRKGQRLRLTCSFPIENPEIKSLTPLFPAANWMEREAYDFFGIRFIGHPNLKRILNIETMTVFPMRKDFPLEDQSRDDKNDRMFGR
ncbi:MAG TPA: NADH-quinone oxidoreductase subunit C [Rectinemataceae bacterium]|nr:NADH-quinone oxidoreductase subunit C [Rectinemataceae bacterium]